MGDSAKLQNPGPDTYRFAIHRKYLAGFIDAVIGPAQSITFVVHDWGSALGFDWANHHRDRVRGIAYMEGNSTPVRRLGRMEQGGHANVSGFSLRKGRGDDFGSQRVRRAGAAGIDLAQIVRRRDGGISKTVSQAGGSLADATWPRQIPIGGEPADVVQVTADYSTWMAENELPKLFVNAEPGAILIGAVRDFCRTWKKPDRSDSTGLAFYPGGFRSSDRPGGGGVDEGPFDLTRIQSVMTFLRIVVTLYVFVRA